jgi:L-seryl-tRNA(Ser) seleniumtransferase
MDVHPETWTWRHLIADGTLDGPPLQGIGRACKVGREEVAGLVVALERFVARDHAAELQSRQVMASAIAAGLMRGLGGIDAVRVEVHDGASSWRPSVTVAFEGPTRRARVIGVTNRLASGDSPVAVGQGGLDRGVLSLSTACLESAEVEVLVGAVVRAVIDEVRAR